MIRVKVRVKSRKGYRKVQRGPRKLPLVTSTGYVLDNGSVLKRRAERKKSFERIIQLSTAD